MKDNEVTLEEALNAFIHKNGLQEKLDETTLLKNWHEIAGPLISKHTKRIFLKDKKLFIEIDSPIIKNEAYYNRTAFAEMINRESGKELVNEIVLL